MTYPIIIGGVEAGALSVSTEGLFTIFEAQAKTEGLVRLCVCGGGKRGYLGVMQPWNGGLYLRRRLSRSELRQFPDVIEYAAALEELEAAEERTDSRAVEIEEAPVAAEDNTPPTANEGSAAPNELCADSPSVVEDERIWFARADGTLVCLDGEHSIIAIPAELRRRAPGAVMRIINGRSYMLFRY